MHPAWAEAYIGIPYVEEGRDLVRDGGVDCWGLLLLIWRERYGIVPPAYDGPHWHKGADAAEIGVAIERESARYTEIAPGCEREGDAIKLRLRGHPLHIGLVIAPGWMIHTHETAAVCIENYRGLAWNRRVLGFYRV